MKFKLYVDEIRSYKHEIIIEAESEAEVDRILDKVESKKNSNFEEYKNLIKEKLKTVEILEDKKGQLADIECQEFEEVEQ